MGVLLRHAFNVWSIIDMYAVHLRSVVNVDNTAVYLVVHLICKCNPTIVGSGLVRPHSDFLTFCAQEVQHISKNICIDEGI